MARKIVFRESANLKTAPSLLLVLVILIIFYFFSVGISGYFKRPDLIKPSELSPPILDNFDQIIAKKDYKDFESFTKTQGVVRAYDLLKKAFSKNETEAHDFAHIVGIVVYEEKGMSGLSTCDTAYNYGCFHGFMESFLAQNSMEKVGLIEKACQDLGYVHAPSCLHGIGHGMMVESAYDLNKALSSCHLLAQQSQIYCFDGVFMERIVASMLAVQKRSVVTENTWDVPCRDVAYIYKNQCWRNQVATWFGFYAGNSKLIGEKCLRIEPEFGQMCFETVGINLAMIPTLDIQAVASLCAIAPNGSVSDDCIIGLMKELMFEGRSKEFAGSLCQKVSLERKQNCLQVFGQLTEEYKARFGG